MKNLAFLLLLTAGVASAQSDENEEIRKFQAAVVKGDAEAVASMTQLPFMLDNKNLDRAKFVKVVPEIFNAKMKKCFATAKTVKDQNGFDIFCGQQMFVFERVGGTLKFTTLGAND